MKKIFLLLLFFISVKAFAQYPAPTGVTRTGTMIFFTKIVGSDTLLYSIDSYGKWYPHGRVGGSGGAFLPLTFTGDNTVDLNLHTLNIRSTADPNNQLFSSFAPGYWQVDAVDASNNNTSFGSAPGDIFMEAIPGTGGSGIQLHFTPDTVGAVFSDYINLRGIDYEASIDTANFGPNTLVTKKYVLAHSGGFTFANGLTNDGSGNISLGGTLNASANTVLTFGSGRELILESATTTAQAIFYDNGINLQSNTSGSNKGYLGLSNANTEFGLTGVGAILFETAGKPLLITVASGVGASYASDYSTALRLKPNSLASTKEVILLGDSIKATISAGGVTSVTGTPIRITSTGGTTPVIDISATFEALLGKVASPLSQFASTTSAQLAGVLSDESGSGLTVFNNSPILITPALGTPSAAVLTNATGLPLTSGVTGILPGANGGTGVNNGSSTITLAGNVTYSGSFTQAFAATGNTSVTLPVSGTLATLAGSETFTNKTLTSPIINVTSDATGDIYYRSSGGAFTRLPIGSSTNVLTVTAGLPAWAAAPTGAISTVSNADGTLIISPTTGAVVASLALGHANTWTAAQTINLGTLGTTSTPAFVISNTTPSTSSVTSQISGGFDFINHVWNTTATAADNIGQFRWEAVGTSGTTPVDILYLSGGLAASSPTLTKGFGMTTTGAVGIGFTSYNSFLWGNKLNVNGNITLTDGTNVFALQPQASGMRVVNSSTGQGVQFLNSLIKAGGSLSTSPTANFTGVTGDNTSATIGLDIQNSSTTSIFKITGDKAITISLGSRLFATEGTNGIVGQTALVAGTKAVTITGVTTSTRAFVTLVNPSGTSLTTQYQAVCTSNTLTLQANVAAGTINVADASTLNYFIVN